MAGSSLTWQVEYARFMRYPPLDAFHSTHPFLIVHSAYQRKRFDGGAWLKTSGTTAVVKLIATGSDNAVLILSLHHRTLEEHFISKLHFSWPQMSCVSQSPVRGSRAVFASYKDSAGQIQIFSMRFQNASESQSFVNSLKESLKYVTTVGTLSINTPSQIQSQNGPTTVGEELYPSTDFEDRVYPTDNHDPLVQSHLDDGVQYASPEEARLTNDHQGVCPDLPPSFTTVNADCCTETRIDAAESQKDTEEVDLQSQFVKYMTGSSFQAMLSKLERVISDMGGDLVLQLP